MAGLVPAIHVFVRRGIKTWMPATSAGMTSQSAGMTSQSDVIAGPERIPIKSNPDVL